MLQCKKDKEPHYKPQKNEHHENVYKYIQHIYRLIVTKHKLLNKSHQQFNVQNSFKQTKKL